MVPRRYNMDKRARAAAETRQRIVEATFALHAEQGIAETTMKQIAERADVGLGTVYHHFPNYGDAVRACGAYTMETTSPPDESVLAGATDGKDRVRLLVRALFDFYDRCPGLAKARADQHRIGALDEAMADWDRRLDSLVAAALRPFGRSRRRDAVVASLLDYEVLRRLKARGLGTHAGADEVAAVLLAWLPAAPDDAGQHQPPASRRQTG